MGLYVKLYKENRNFSCKKLCVKFFYYQLLDVRWIMCTRINLNLNISKAYHIEIKEHTYVSPCRTCVLPYCASDVIYTCSVDMGFVISSRCNSMS